MLMFREEKSPEDEIKAWQFWHGRQHSVKQRILDAGKFIITNWMLLKQLLYQVSVMAAKRAICKELLVRR